MASVPTTPANLAKIEAMFANMEGMLVGLAGRWADESEYEDILKYGEVVKKALPEGFEFNGMTKRPFGFKFGLAGNQYVIMVGSKHYQWKRVA